MVGDDPVDLLRHAPVEGAKAGLDVGDRDVELGRSERPRERRVRVAIDEDRVGSLGRGGRSRSPAASARSAPPGFRRRSRGSGPAAAARAPRRTPRPSPRPSAARCRPAPRRGVPQRRRQGRRLDQLRSRPDDADDPQGRPRRSGYAAGSVAGRARPGRQPDPRGTRPSPGGRGRARLSRPSNTTARLREPGRRIEAVRRPDRRSGSRSPGTAAGSPQVHGVAPQRAISSGVRSGS